MSTQTIRIAVRKFGPFEAAIRAQFDDFVRATGVDAALDMDVFEVDAMPHALFEGGGLRDGTYDVAFIVTDWLAPAVDDGLLADLRPLIEADPLPPGDGIDDAWGASLMLLQRLDGGFYGMPYHDGPECLIYRTDLIDAPPRTWDEFLATSARVADPSAGRYGCVVAAMPDGHNTVYDFTLQLWTRGGELLGRDKQPTLDTPASRGALAFYRELVRHPATMPDAKSIHSVPAGAAFLRGDVAMMANWFGFASAAQTLPESAVRDKIGVAPIPAGPGGHSTSLNVFWMLSIPSGSANKALAWKFLKHCATAEMDKLLTLGGAVGTRLSTWSDSDVNARIPFFKQLIPLHEDARTFPVDRRLPALLHEIERALVRTLDTDDDVADVARDLQRDASAVWNAGDVT